MKTKLLLLTLLISSLSFAQYTAIPDANFENALSAYDDIANDGQVPTANINTLTSLNVSSKNIANLAGIKDFSALTNLNCSYNQLSNLNISHNTNLTELHCPGNQLGSLNLSQNTNLTYLDCSVNQLSSLNLSQNTNLEWLLCSNNQLTDLNLNQITNLTYLDCSVNQLSSLDLNQNANLTYLFCSFNNLGGLDISQNTNLTQFNCHANQLSSLDISQNVNLNWLNCSTNQLNNLNIKNGNNTNISYFDAANNPNLLCIEVDDVAWSTANWTNIDPQTSFSTDCAAGVDESALNKAIEIYPNPVNHILNLSAQDPIENVHIYNVTGQEVINLQPNTADIQVNMSKLQKGIYFVKVQIDGRVSAFNVVKE